MTSDQLLAFIEMHIKLTRSFALKHDVHIMATKKPGVYVLNGDWDETPEGDLLSLLALAREWGVL